MWVPGDEDRTSRFTEKREGDWDCHECNAHNFAGRFRCFKCEVMKEMTPKEAERYKEWQDHEKLKLKKDKRRKKKKKEKELRKNSADLMAWNEDTKAIVSMIRKTVKGPDDAKAAKSLLYSVLDLTSKLQKLGAAPGSLPLRPLSTPCASTCPRTAPGSTTCLPSLSLARGGIYEMDKGSQRSCKEVLPGAQRSTDKKALLNALGTLPASRPCPPYTSTCPTSTYPTASMATPHYPPACLPACHTL
eukprot:gene7172-1281_t